MVAAEVVALHHFQNTGPNLLTGRPRLAPGPVRGLKTVMAGLLSLGHLSLRHLLGTLLVLGQLV